MTALDFVLMVPTDNPLVALAVQLGYTISIISAGTSYPRYRGDLSKGVSYYNDDLLCLLSTMIQDDLALSHLAQPSALQEQQEPRAGEQLQFKDQQ